MIYLDSIIFELQRAGGISVYWFELLSRHQLNQITCFGRENDNIFAADLELELKSEAYPNFMPRRYLPFKPENSSAPKGRHIFHSSYFRYSNHSDAINVTTVYDFTYEYHSSGIRKLVHGTQKALAIKKSAGIICISNNTKQDLLKLYPWIDSNIVRVIHISAGAEFFPLNSYLPELNKRLKYDVDNPFLLFVGDRSPYKNFDIFVQLADYFPDFDLVVVGGRPFSEAELHKIKPIANRVLHFSGISSEVLNMLYNAAFCLVYPSSYEGFGIPILEAMKAGCPVVSTNLSSIPEVAGDAALLVDQPTAESLAIEIQKLADPDFRGILLEKGFKQAEKFSWDKCFEETYAFYQELWERSDIK